MTANPLLLFGSGGWIRTNDLWVMSITNKKVKPSKKVNIYRGFAFDL